ncbi:MAG: tetratricopeptide repeat protein [Oscillospiraceae bacterium]|nr:tetratricopeptide repeat protein [Oscillospiraceae bacterium]
MEITEYLAAVDRAYDTLRGGELEARLLELLAQAEAQFGPRSREYASLLSEAGGYYRGQSRLEASEDCFARALDILPAGTADYGTALNNLAGTHRLMGRLDEAEAEFLTCLEILRQTGGPERILLAAAMNNLSLLYLDRDRPDEAARWLNEAAAILAALPEHREEYASSLCNLAALDLRMGRAEAAEERLRTAVALYENELGTDTPHYHSALNSLGVALWRENDPAGAAAAFEKGLDAVRALYGEEHPDYARLAAHRDAALERLENA